MLQAASQYRQSRASLYKTGLLPEREPEYVPWTGENNENIRQINIRFKALANIVHMFQNV